MKQHESAVIALQVITSAEADHLYSASNDMTVHNSTLILIPQCFALLASVGQQSLWTRQVACHDKGKFARYAHLLRIFTKYICFVCSGVRSDFGI